MTLTIRPPSAADLAVIVDFNLRLARESEGKALDPAVLTRGVQKVLDDPARASYFLAEQAGRVVGQLMITLEWSDWRDGWIWWIQSVYVHPDARRAGVFRALFDHVVAEGLRRGDVVGLRLYVENANAAAQATYRRLGMKDAGYFVLERCPLEAGS